jgi:hypothetical protein
VRPRIAGLCSSIDGVEERTDGEVGEDLPALLGVVAVAGVVVHHEAQRARGAQSFSRCVVEGTLKQQISRYAGVAPENRTTPGLYLPIGTSM